MLVADRAALKLETVGDEAELLLVAGALVDVGEPEPVVPLEAVAEPALEEAEFSPTQLLSAVGVQE